MYISVKKLDATQPSISSKTKSPSSVPFRGNQMAEHISQLQRAIGNQAFQHSVLNKLNDDAVRSPGEPLDADTRLFMEPLVRNDLSCVRLHTNGKAGESAEAVGALAYTVGSDIVFANGRYDPHSVSGARLLGHELIHVAQGRGNPSPLRRKPDPNKLTITVPDPTTVDVFKPSVDYTWQNENLRASLFPHRDHAFREFLRKEKKLDLQKEKTTGFPTELLTEIGEKILAERAGLDLELKQHKQERLKAEADLRTTQTERKKYVSQPEVRAQERQKRQLEAQERSLAAKVQAQEARIAVLEGKDDKINLSEQTELDRRHEMLIKIQDELTETTQLIEDVNGMLEPTLAPLREAETRLKGEIEEHRKQEKILGPKFKRVSGGVHTKTKQTDRDTAANWLLEEYVQRINSLDHDELLGLVLDRFDVDKDFTRYPKQERYLIIHFSGMRYATAHNTYGPPKELTATLKEQEIRELFEDPNRTAEVEQAANETETLIESEMKSGETGSSRKAELRTLKKGLVDTPVAVRAALFKKNPQLEELEMLTSERTKALEQKDDARATDLSQLIEQLEQAFGEPKLKKLRASLQAADLNRLKVLRDFRVKEAKAQISKLTDEQALGVLEAMKDQFPDWVWELVVRRTQLRVNFTGSIVWKDSKKPTKEDKKRALADPRWKKIMDNWPRESSSWNPKHAERYEIVAETVVCNQLSEQVQHLYGKKITQGIRGAVNWYRKQESDAIAAGATGASLPFFKRPTMKEDFVPGAGLFWAHFEKNKKPYKGNMAHELNNIPFLTTNKQVMKDGLVVGEWSYHIDKTTGDITRTRGKDDKIDTEWFAWQHEATVMKLYDKDNVVTFETLGGSRWTTRSLQELLDPMSVSWKQKAPDDTNLFVGFAPERAALPELDKSLKKVLPGRNAY